MAALSITGQLKVSSLQKKFLKEFGLVLRVYDGRALADADQTLAQTRKQKGSGSGLSVAKNMKIGNLERKFQVEFGLKVQVAGSDDSYLCNDDLTLNAAHLEDEKKLIRKARKLLREENNDSAVDSEVERALLAVLDGVMELRENEDDWIFETLDEARDDTFRECEIDEIAEKEKFTSVEQAVESEIFSNDQKMRIIKQWVRCIEDLTEVEIGIS
jgi:hypothetical protein